MKFAEVQLANEAANKKMMTRVEALLQRVGLSEGRIELLENASKYSQNQIKNLKQPHYNKAH